MTTDTMRRALLALALAATANMAMGADLQLASRSISTADGLPSNNINCIAQDPDGYVWLGTSNGLSRFDGYSAVNFTGLSPVPGEPTDRHIGSITVDGHNLRVTTANSACATYNLEEARFTAYTMATGRRRRLGTLKGMPILAKSCYEGDSLMVTDGMVTRLNANGRVAGAYRMPPAMGNMGRVVFCFVWGKRFVIMADKSTFALDMTTGRFAKPDELQVESPVYQCSTPGCIYVSNVSGDLWMFAEGKPVRRFSLLSNAPYAQTRRHRYYAADDGKGHVFIATYGNGLFVFDKATENMGHYSASDRHPVIYSDFLTCATTDRDGNIWIGSEAAGAVCLSVMEDVAARYIYPEPGNNDETANHIYALRYETDGRLTACTRKNELVSVDCDGGTPALKAGRLPAPAFAMMTDSHGRPWTGTRGAGLFIGRRHYHTGSKDSRLPCDDIYDLAEAPRNHFWIATWGGGLLRATLDGQGTLRWQAMLDGSPNERRVRCLADDGRGTMWAGTDNGLYAISYGGQGKKPVTAHRYNLQNRRLRGNEVITMLYSKRSGLWIGVHGHGLAHCSVKNGRLTATKYFDAAHGLAGNIVNSIAEDAHGNIWAATEEGISCVNPATLAVASYNFAPTLMGNVFIENSAATDGSGRLFFGSRQGILAITPHKAPTRQTSARCALTDIRINGVSALTMDGNDRPLTSALTRTRHISLGHTENSLTLLFSDFEYSKPHSTLYQYMLEGIDANWHEPTSLNHADYGNLPPGRYTFRLRKFTPDGHSPETSLLITIRQPWYNTWWAWLAYAMAASAVALALIRGWQAKSRLRRKMEIERSLSEFRLNFFTHIAHEFRTPLAIIQGAIDKICDAGDNHPPRSAVATAMRGTRRLSRLVDRLMEFRKINANSLRLRVEPGDVIGFVHDVLNDFLPMARQKGISLTFTPFARSFEMPFDRHMVETITYNLLSNAIKYTPQKGSVELTVKLGENENSITIAVADTGPGIAAEQQEHLFEPFMHGYVSQGGMGIGLFLAKNMARLHHGSLDYRRGPNGQGSVFTVVLPTSLDAYTPDEVRPKAIDNEYGRESRPTGTPIETAFAMNDVRVAIVEDDPDMMEQLRNELGNYFKTDTYMDGAEAAKGITAQPPALVVCDVMLPGMSGYDVVKHLKSNSATSSLPVIMLTALDDEEHQIKGYKAGADDYMVNPCNLRVLLARAAQLIRWQSATVAQQQDGGTAAHKGQGALLTSQSDKVFRDRIDTIIRCHLKDQAFTTDTLAEMMHVGRTKLYGKTKETTGMSPGKYIMKIRMETAATLLAEGKLNVSEVGMAVGISEPSYFYRCFKGYHGVAPSKYTKR